MKKSIIIFAAVAALFSCAKENPTTETPAQETFSVTLTASAPTSEDAPSPASADTKTTLVDGNNKKFVHWSQGDAIKVLFFPKHTINAGFSGSNGVFTSDFEGETSAVADFKCDSWSWGSTVSQNGISYSLNDKGIALYPSTATAQSTKPSGSPVICDTEVSFVLPSTQAAVKDNIESNLNFSYATVELSKFQSAISNGAQTDLKFNNVCAMIELTMPSTFDKKVTSISIASNNDVPLTGKGVAVMSYYKNEIDSNPYDSASDYIFKPEISEGAGVTLNNANGFETGAKYYVVVWPGKHDSGLTIQFTAEDGSKATKTTGTVDLTASKVKPYTFNKGLVFESASYDYYYSDATVGNDPNPAGKSVIGVIFYNGNPRNLDATLPSSCTHGLAISVKKAQLKWHTANLPNSNYANYGLDNKSGNIWGYEAKQLWKYDVGMDLNLYNITSPIPSLPAIGDYVSGTGWYHATNCELSLLAADYTRVKDLLAACSGDALPTSSNTCFWTPLVKSTSQAYMAYYQSYSNSFYLTYTYLTNAYYIQPIFAF